MFFFQKTGEGGGVQKLDNVYTVGPDIRTPDNASAYADLIWVQIILYVILFHLSRIPRSVSGRSVLPQNTVLLSILLHLTERKNSMISRLIQQKDNACQLSLTFCLRARQHVAIGISTCAPLRCHRFFKHSFITNK